MEKGFWHYFCINHKCLAPLLTERPYKSHGTANVAFTVDLKPLPVAQRRSREEEAADLEAVSNAVRAEFRIAGERGR